MAAMIAIEATATGVLISSTDTNTGQRITLYFPTRDEAEAFATAILRIVCAGEVADALGTGPLDRLVQS